MRSSFRQAAPAPLYVEDHDEYRPAPLTALRAAACFWRTRKDRGARDRTLLANSSASTRDACRIRTSNTFCCMIRERRGHEFVFGPQRYSRAA